MIDLGLTDAALRGEWWRLWTGHFVHWDAQHLAANAVAALVPFLALPNRMRMKMLIWGAAAAPLLSLFVLAFAPRGEMRGASGLAAGFWVFAGIALLRSGERRLGLMLLGALAMKLIAEASGFVQPHAGYVTLSMLHYAAAVLAAGAACAIDRERFTTETQRTQSSTEEHRGAQRSTEGVSRVFG
ncbi:MAG: rhomboid family intramembrane serine protease [Thermoanaerobaculia bacterium]